MSNILMLVNGPPGSGKGTFLEILGKICRVPIWGLGNTFREEREKNSALWQRAQDFMRSERVSFWPHNLVYNSLLKAFRGVKVNNLILDAFPYDFSQMRDIIPILEHFELNRLVSIEVELSDKKCKERSCLRKRSDDGNICKRLKDYHRYTRPALDETIKLQTAPFRVDRITLDGSEMMANAPSFAFGIAGLYKLLPNQ